MQHLNLLTDRNIADFVSISGIVPFITAVWLIQTSQPELAIIVITISFVIDTLDGKLARLTDRTTQFGRELDSFLDLLYYIAFPIVFILKFLNPWTPAIIVTLSFVGIAGILRLIRFNEKGFILGKDKNNYPGLPIVYYLLVPIIFYLLSELVSTQLVWLIIPTTLLVSTLMISKKPIPKPENGLWYAITLIINVLLVLLWTNII
jgi:CDP-diacylglycerol--serine O-phosphatidyltransferase